MIDSFVVGIITAIVEGVDTPKNKVQKVKEVIAALSAAKNGSTENDLNFFELEEEEHETD